MMNSQSSNLFDVHRDLTSQQCTKPINKDIEYSIRHGLDINDMKLFTEANPSRLLKVEAEVEALMLLKDPLEKATFFDKIHDRVLQAASSVKTYHDIVFLLQFACVLDLQIDVVNNRTSLHLIRHVLNLVPTDLRSDELFSRFAVKMRSLSAHNSDQAHLCLQVASLGPSWTTLALYLAWYTLHDLLDHGLSVPKDITPMNLLSTLTATSRPTTVQNMELSVVLIGLLVTRLNLEGGNHKKEIDGIKRWLCELNEQITHSEGFCGLNQEMKFNVTSMVTQSLMHFEDMNSQDEHENS